MARLSTSTPTDPAALGEETSTSPPAGSSATTRETTNPITHVSDRPRTKPREQRADPEQTSAIIPAIGEVGAPVMWSRPAPGAARTRRARDAADCGTEAAD